MITFYNLLNVWMLVVKEEGEGEVERHRACAYRFVEYSVSSLRLHESRVRGKDDRGMILDASDPPQI